MPSSPRWHRFNRPAQSSPGVKPETGSDGSRIADTPPDHLTIAVLRVDHAGRVYFPRPGREWEPRWSPLDQGFARLTWSLGVPGPKSKYDSRGRLTLPPGFRKRLMSAEVVFLTAPEAVSLVLDASQVATVLWGEYS